MCAVACARRREPKSKGAEEAPVIAGPRYNGAMPVTDERPSVEQRLSASFPLEYRSYKTIAGTLTVRRGDVNALVVSHRAAMQRAVAFSLS